MLISILENCKEPLGLADKNKIPDKSFSASSEFKRYVDDDIFGRDSCSFYIGFRLYMYKKIHIILYIIQKNYSREVSCWF